MSNQLAKRLLATIFAVALFVPSSKAQLAAPGECYGTTGLPFPISAKLVKIDTLSGVSDSVKTSTGYFGFPGLAIDSQGKIFVVHSSGGFAGTQDDSLFTMDAVTAEVTRVVRFSTGGGQGFSALAFDENDVLYGTRTGAVKDLVTIDTATGAVVSVLNLGVNMGGLAYDRSTGLLYASNSGSEVDKNAIYVIDPSVPDVTKIGNLVAGGQGVSDLFFDRTGDLYATHNLPQNILDPVPSNLYSVNKATGVGTLIGNTGHRIAGADCYNPAADEPPPPVAIEVDVDIYPAECPNEFNVNKNGKMNVSIQGTLDFDVTTIDPSTITLRGVAPVKVILEDVSRPSSDDECSCTADGPDGILDLKLQFDQPDVLAAMGDVEDGQVVALPLAGATTDSTEIVGEDCVTIKVPGKGQKTDKGDLAEFRLEQNYPNPFNPTTSISFSLPIDAHVNLVIYNTMGQEVRRLVSEIRTEGYHEVAWDGTDQFGNEIPSGVYLYRVTADEFVQTRRMMLLK